MNSSGKLALAVVLGIALMSLCAPLLSSYDPDRIDLDSLRNPPGSMHLLGTDHKGRDMFSRILYGGRISLGIAGLATVCSMAVGLLLGLCSGYFGGKVDAVIMGCVDLVLAFPSLPWLIFPSPRTQSHEVCLFGKFVRCQGSSIGFRTQAQLAGPCSKQPCLGMEAIGIIGHFGSSRAVSLTEPRHSTYTSFTFRVPPCLAALRSTQ